MNIEEEETTKSFKDHIQTRILEIEAILTKQRKYYRLYRITYNTLIFSSLISSLSIPVLEIFCPFSIISCVVTFLGLLSSLSVGVLTKFNINSKKDKSRQDIVLLKQTWSEAKRMLLYNREITQNDMEKLFQKLDYFI